MRAVTAQLVRLVPAYRPVDHHRQIDRPAEGRRCDRTGVGRILPVSAAGRSDDTLAAEDIFAARVDPDTGDLALSGELDLAGADRLRSCVPRLPRPATSRITVDVRELRFIDAAGMGALVEFANAARSTDPDAALALTHACAPVRRALAAAALTHLLSAS